MASLIATLCLGAQKRLDLLEMVLQKCGERKQTLKTYLMQIYLLSLM